MSLTWDEVRCKANLFDSYDSEKFNNNCFVSQTYFVASELRPAVVYRFVLNGPRVFIVVCSPGYRSIRL